MIMFGLLTGTDQFPKGYLLIAAGEINHNQQ
jgi:hypothetical protein